MGVKEHRRRVCKSLCSWKAPLGKNIPCHTRELNLHQQHACPTLSPTDLYSRPNTNPFPTSGTSYDLIGRVLPLTFLGNVIFPGWFLTFCALSHTKQCLKINASGVLTLFLTQIFKKKLKKNYKAISRNSLAGKGLIRETREPVQWKNLWCRTAHLHSPGGTPTVTKLQGLDLPIQPCCWYRVLKTKACWNVVVVFFTRWFGIYACSYSAQKILNLSADFGVCNKHAPNWHKNITFLSGNLGSMKCMCLWHTESCFFIRWFGIYKVHVSISHRIKFFTSKQKVF